MQTADSEHLVALTVPVVLPAAVGSVLPDKSSLRSSSLSCGVCVRCVECVCGGVKVTNYVTDFHQRFMD